MVKKWWKIQIFFILGQRVCNKQEMRRALFYIVDVHRYE